MTANWFECKIKYIKIGAEGKESKVTESYLLDAMSYTEAEGRMTTILSSMGQNAFEIATLKKSNISELVESTDGYDDKWFKAKIGLLDADQISGKEKRSYIYMLIAAADIERALKHLLKSLSTYVIPYEIASLTETPILDVFPYFPNEADMEVAPDDISSEGLS